MPKLWRRQVEVQVRGVADRRDVAGAVPGRAHPEELAEDAQLARRRQPANVRDVDADEVDQAVADQRHVLVLVHEQLAHRDRDHALLAQDAEVVVVLRREEVFQEEQVELLQLLRQAASP